MYAFFETGSPTRCKFYVYATLTEFVDVFKYLGLHLFKNNKWNRAQKRLASHAAIALHDLFLTFYQLDLST